MSLILVDVDGVLNALGNPPGTTPHKIKLPNSDFTLYMNTTHGKWLNKLAEDTGWQLTWCTYWEENAVKLIAPILGLPQMPVIKINPPFGYYDIPEVKAKAAANYANGRDFVYFDDEFGITNALVKLHAKGKHIYVEPYDGLQEWHIESARQYIVGL